MIHEKGFNLMTGAISNTTMEKPADKRSEDMKNKSNNNINLDHQKVILKCPRCDSLNTKFCYYNNYSLSQPRHLCRDCKRYWTRGGILRNVPHGSATCKNKNKNKNNKKFLNKPPQTLSSSVQILDPNAAVLYGLPTNHVMRGFHHDNIIGFCSNSVNYPTMGYGFQETLAGEGFQNQINPSISDLYWNNTTWLDHSSSSSSAIHDYSAPSLI